MYLPFATEGLALITLVITVAAFSTSFCASNEILPTGTCTSAVLSVRNSTLPALVSLTAAATSNVTVPVFGFGINPRGPSTLPRRPTDFIMSGVEITASKSVQFSFWIFSTMSSPPTKSAPAASASRCFSPDAMTRTFLVLPRPCGRITVPRTIWSACLGSTPRRIVRSTVSSNLANFTFWRRGTASCSVYGCFSIPARAFSTFFPDFFMLLLVFHRRPLLRRGRGLRDWRLHRHKIYQASYQGTTSVVPISCLALKGHGFSRAVQPVKNRSRAGFSPPGLQLRRNVNAHGARG